MSDSSPFRGVYRAFTGYARCGSEGSFRGSKDDILCVRLVSSNVYIPRQPKPYRAPIGTLPYLNLNCEECDGSRKGLAAEMTFRCGYCLRFVELYDQAVA